MKHITLIAPLALVFLVSCKSRSFNSDVKQEATECKTGLEVSGANTAADFKFFSKQHPKKIFTCKINVNLKICSNTSVVSTDVGFEARLSPLKNTELLNWIGSQTNDCSMLDVIPWTDLVATTSGASVKPIGPVEKPADEEVPLSLPSATGPITSTANATRIFTESSKWNNKFFRFGETAQCANFVRAVLSDSCSKKFADTTPGALQSFKPWDLNIIGSGAPLSIGYANSLAGAEIGEKIANIDDAKPGDLVFFKNTYGDWPDGTITHVGIYAGSRRMIDRPTFDGPVLHRAMPMRLFVGALRVRPELCKQ